MTSVFISYSGSRIERALLFNALRDHGVTPWRDADSLELGDRTTESIVAEIESCAGVIIWVNTAVLASDYVALVELPAIGHAYHRGLRIVPIFDGLSPTEGADLLSEHGIEIGDSNGYVVDPATDPQHTAIKIARRYVRAHVADAFTAGRPPIVRLVSYDDTADLRDDAVLNFDWRQRFAGGVLDIAAEAELRDALAFSSAALKELYGAAEIETAIKAHLPLAVALGHSFAEPTGCRLRMRRADGVYVTDRGVSDVAELDARNAPLGPIVARAASVEVSVSRSVGAGVNAYVGLATRYRHRIMLEPTAGPDRASLDSPATALAWARQIAHAVINLSDRREVDRVDLFLATTVELAAMVGWWLNAAGHINVMNWTGKTGPYERMWSLP